MTNVTTASQRGLYNGEEQKASRNIAATPIFHHAAKLNHPLLSRLLVHKIMAVAKGSCRGSQGYRHDFLCRVALKVNND